MAYSTFANLPASMQERIRSAIDPPDPEAWIRTRIAVLINKSFLEIVNGPQGEAAANAYLESVEYMEKSWTSASSVAFDATSDSYRFALDRKRPGCSEFGDLATLRFKSLAVFFVRRVMLLEIRS